MKSKNSTQLKRTLCLVMAIILAFGVFFNAAFVANAAEERNDNFGGAPVDSGSNWKYYSDGELVITDDIADCSEESPAEWHKYAASIRTITIQEGVTSIGAYAFYEFTGTSKVYVPGTVTSISSDAFKGFALTYGAFGGDEDAYNSIFPATGVAIQINHKHTDGAVKHKKTATCKDDGYTGDTYCASCGAFFKAGEIIKSQTVPHTWSTTMKTKDEPTCQKVGHKGYYCTKCGAFKEDSLVEIPKSGHNWEFDGNQISNCKTANSNIVLKCTNEGCSATKTEKVTDHTYLYKVVDPTCTEEGYTLVTCKYCTAVNNKTDKKAALGHNADKLIVVKETTCTENGTYKHVCSRCGEVDKITTIAAYGHDYTKEVVTVDPTCPVYDKATQKYTSTGEGQLEVRCSRCGDVKETKPIPNLHTEGSWSITKYVGYPATCVNDGAYYFKCNACGEDLFKEDATANTTDTFSSRTQITEPIPKTPNSHNASKWITIYEPTCEDTGLMIKKCTTSGCPCHSDGAIGAAIDKASNDTAVKAVIGTVDDALADSVADYILNQYYALKDPDGADIAALINANVTAKNITFDSTDDETLAGDIIDRASAAIAADTTDDATIVITKQLIIDYLTAAFDEIGDEWVATAVAAASEEEINLVANVTLDSQIIAANGHKYQTVSYYKSLVNGKDVYNPVVMSDGTDGEGYRDITGWDFAYDDDGNQIFDRNGEPVYEPLFDDTTSPIDTETYPVYDGVDCNVGGTLVKMCAVCCGVTATDVAKGQHKYIDETIAPTCTEQGYKLQTCEFCTYNKTYDYTPSIGHNWQKVDLQDSTCTKTGLQAMQCQNCGEIDKTTFQPISKIPHDYIVETIDPTCTADGYTQHTCSVCGGGYRDQYVDALGHDLVDTVTDATCTKDGYTTHTCSVCGYEYKDTPVLSIGHQYGEAKEIPATCTEDAYTQQICTVCGEEKKTAVQDGTATGHTFIDDPKVAVTCTTDGKTAGQHCDICGYVNIPQETIPATGHKVVEIAAVSATCTAAGHSAGSYCSVCGEILEGTTTYPAKGHTPNRSKATCTESKICTVCGATLEKAKGHTPSAEEYIKKEATAFRKGIKYRVCTVCGTSDGLEYEYSLNFIQKIVWIFTHFLDIILALLGRANNVF